MTSASFYKPAHGHIYDAVSTLTARGEPVDPVTVADELRRADLLDQLGGPSVLLSLQANTPATSNAGRYAQIVEDHALLRRLITVASEISELGYSLPDDVIKTLDTAETMVYDLSQNRITDSTAELRDLLPETLSRIEMLYDRGDVLTGTPTGYTDLDDLTSGLQPEALIVVGARPAMGKTAFVLGMATHAAMHAGKPVLFFSLEMSRLELSQRLLSAEARVDSRRMASGRLEDSCMDQDHRCGRSPRRGAPVAGRQPQRVDRRDPRQGEAALVQGRRPGPDRGRLHPAHDGPVQRREPPG